MSTRIKVIIVAAIIAILGVIGAFFGSSAFAGPPTGGITTQVVYTACVHEDGPATCGWDAQERSNGVGQSYILLTNGGQVNLNDRLCGGAITVSCRDTIDAQYHITQWRKANGSKVQVYDRGFGPGVTTTIVPPFQGNPSPVHP